MTEDLNALIGAFEDVGLSRGTMNGSPLTVASSQDGGHKQVSGCGSVLGHLREYERKNGKSRSWRDSMQMRIRQSVVQARQKRAEKF
jgi:hypothetical protein